MKIVHAADADVFENPTMRALEYTFGDAAINVARIEIHGRYPEAGRSVNREVKEVCYVLEGSGTVYVEGEAYPFSAGDALLIQPGERFYWEAEAVLLVPTTPAWTVEQYELL